MELVINGKTKEVKENIKVGELLDELGIREKTMAVAVDMEVVKKENWDEKVLQNGQKIEFLHFVGGGWWTLIYENVIIYIN